ncbi:MAG: histidine ammonia-lyase [bacterium]
MKRTIELDGRSLSLKTLKIILRDVLPVNLSRRARRQMLNAREYLLRKMREPVPLYGINTGVGALKSVRIPPSDRLQLQHNLIRSHAAGWGDPFSEDVVRATLIIHANNLARPYAAARPQIVEKLLEFHNKNVIPFVPKYGSVGASGDLIPLAHIALNLMGEGEVFVYGRRAPAKRVLASRRIAVLSPLEKEGLSLINGTAISSALLAVGLIGIENLIEAGEVAAALSTEVLMGSPRAFSAAALEVRPHPGALRTGERLTRLMKNSGIVRSHVDCGRVQDAYSIRCTPQVLGAVRDLFTWARSVLEIEMNSTTDNPIVVPSKDEVLFAGNFHGEPLGLAMDALRTGVVEVAGISERRLYRMLDPNLSDGLPPFLAPASGLNSGYMMAQYLAASLLGEMKVLSTPATKENIVTSAGQEDFVSFSNIAGSLLLDAIEKAEVVVAIELLLGCQAYEHRKPLALGNGTGRAYRLVRSRVKRLDDDRTLYKEIETAAALVRHGDVARAAWAATD